MNKIQNIPVEEDSHGMVFNCSLIFPSSFRCEILKPQCHFSGVSENEYSALADRATLRRALHA